VYLVSNSPLEKKTVISGLKRNEKKKARNLSRSNFVKDVRGDIHVDPYKILNRWKY
jgi:hypothetical protein